MAPKFGTSGLRGLVTELTPALVGDHIAAFIEACPMGTGIYVGHDNRDSSSDIAQMVVQTAQARGVPVFHCAAVPTPALALASLSADAAAVMVTGSHIPADRNGLKFYTPTGEITKADEAAILAALGARRADATPQDVTNMDRVLAAYGTRYLDAYAGALAGKRIGVYMHSAVGGPFMCDIARQLGAEVLQLGASDHFIPIDTEAVPDDVRRDLIRWAQEHGLDAIISTDADGDRPLVTDEAGTVIPGDILGQITATSLRANTVVTPISSNTSVAQDKRIAEVINTKIGSPYVIAAMADAAGACVGYEANGGFLLGFDAQGPTGPLAALMTRDAVLPMLAVLTAAKDMPLSELVAAQVTRFTAADRLQEVDPAKAGRVIAKLQSDTGYLDAFLDTCGEAASTQDTTDGLRITLASGRIIHLRPSGNAPELRVYAEAESNAAAAALRTVGMTQVAVLLRDMA